MNEKQSTKYQGFRRAILALGTTNRARAARLGITDRQLWNWLNDGPPKSLRNTPAEVLKALAADVENQPATTGTAD